MSIVRRIWNVILSLALIFCGFIMMAFPEQGHVLVILILGLALIAVGIQRIFFFITMSRHMVGGKMTLFVGVVLLDMGVFTLNMARGTQIYIMIYLFFACGITGAIYLLRAREAKKAEDPQWKLKLIGGIVNIAAAVLSICFVGSANMSVYIFSISLFYDALIRIITSFRRTAIIYVQ